jgi:glycosyltransferase involved in cell wall biosynthesis
MSRPVIGYVLKRFPRLSETFILRELLELERLGVDVRVFALYRSNESTVHADYARLRAPITYVEEEGARVPADVPARGPAEREDKSVRAARKLAPLVEAAGVTHVHAHFATSAAEIARQLGRQLRLPYSVTAHAKDIFHESVSPADLTALVRDAAFVVTVSNYNVGHLRAVTGHQSASTPIHRIYNGLDTAVHALTGDAGRLPEHVLGVGRLVEKKGFDTLIDAMAELRTRRPRAHATIVGTGECAEALRARAAERRVETHVTMAGAQPQAHVLDLMRSHTVLAVPCVVGRDGNRDGLPTVTIEAMALGLPVVSTPVTGIPEIVRHGDTGLLVPEHSPVALAATLDRLMRDSELRDSLRRRARALVAEEFDTRRNVRLLAELFAASSEAGCADAQYLEAMRLAPEMAEAGGAQ